MSVYFIRTRYGVMSFSNAEDAADLYRELVARKKRVRAWTQEERR